MTRFAHKPRSDDSRVRVPVAISAAHVHLSPAVIEALFCDKYQLHEHSRLEQPTQYAAEESVTLIGPRGRVANVPVIGPPRPVTQVELSQSDALALGIDVPIRQSGDLAGTPGIFIEGPRTRVPIESGVIRVLRHIHMSPSDANRLGLEDQERVDVAAERDAQQVLLRDVLVRVSADYRLELHLDLDEAKAVGLKPGDHVVLHRPNAPFGS